MRATGLPSHKGPEHHETGRPGQHHPGGSPTLGRTFDDGPEQEAQPEDREDCTAWVRPIRRRILRARYQKDRRHERRYSDRDVHQEDGAPPEPGQQQAAAIGPMAIPRPMVAPHAPMATALSLGSRKTSLTMESDEGMVSAAPAPMIAREIRSAVVLNPRLQRRSTRPRKRRDR